MKRSSIITGLDIGSSKISSVAAEVDKNGLLRIIAQEFYSAKGISKGVFVDLDEAVDAVSTALGRLKARLSFAIEDIYVNISGPTIKGEKSKGMIPLSLRGREVTRTDIDRSINVASTIRLPFDREIVHKIVQSFSIDDQPWVKNPLGLYASRLACEVYIITANINHIQNIYKCVNNAGYNVTEIVFTGIADAASLLDERDKEEGTVLLDIGASLTEVSFFSGGALKDMEAIAIGAQDIKGDFKVNPVFNNLLSRIRNRAEEFLKKGGDIASVTLTGGLAFADGIVEVLEEKLSYPVKMGVVKDIKGEISSLDSIRGTTAIGLVKYAYEKSRKETLEEKNLVRRLSTKVVDIFNNYF